MLELNKIYNTDCMGKNGMCLIPDKSVNMVLTDIPYEKVNKKSNGLRKIDKENANIITFNLHNFLKEVNRVSKGSILIFCGHEQYSTIYDYFSNQKGTTRGVCWHKTNPSPMNGEYIYLNSFELAVWFKKSKATFNAFCKHNLFNTSIGSSKIFPTQKNLKLFKEIIINDEQITLNAIIEEKSNIYDIVSKIESSKKYNIIYLSPINAYNDKYSFKLTLEVKK
jgi:site-specific DNA-methyltransferase (adenine-specific)